MNCSSIPDYTHTLDLVVALGGIPSAFFFLFPTDYPVNYQSAKSKVRGLHYSRYAILREVVENEFADEVPEEKREAFVLKLLPLVGNVFSVYDLSDDNFALSSDYDLLYTELTGATVLYLDEYGV